MRRRSNVGWIIMGLAVPIWLLGIRWLMLTGKETMGIGVYVLSVGGGTMICGVIALSLIHRAQKRRPHDEMPHNPYFSVGETGQRRDECEQLARSGKIDFQWLDEDLPQRWQTPLLRRGTQPTAHCVLTFSSGEDVVTVFDFLYTMMDSEGVSRVRAQTVAAIPIRGLPAFQLFPETLDRKLIDRFGGFWAQQDIDFADDPKFSSAFVLRSDQEEATRALLHQELRSLLLRDPTQSLEVEGDRLLWFREDSVVRTECLPDLVAKMERLRSALTTKQSVPPVRRPQ